MGIIGYIIANFVGPVDDGSVAGLSISQIVISVYHLLPSDLLTWKWMAWPVE